MSKIEPLVEATLESLVPVLKALWEDLRKRDLGEAEVLRENEAEELDPLSYAEIVAAGLARLFLIAGRPFSRADILEVAIRQGLPKIYPMAVHRAVEKLQGRGLVDKVGAEPRLGAAPVELFALNQDGCEAFDLAILAHQQLRRTARRRAA